MKSILPSIAIAAALSATPAIAQNSTSMNQRNSNQRIMELCANPEFGKNIIDGRNSVCDEYSTDNGLNWYKIGAGASILALIGAGAIFRSRRKKEQTSEVQDIETTTINTTPNSFTGITGEESGDQGEEDDILMNSSGIDDNGPNEETATEDPIESAAVYMAYGRNDRVEEVLLEELGKNPGNIEAYKKLLEIYYHTKNIKKFGKVFMDDELAHFRTGTLEEDMDEIRRWGREIDPGNPIYIDPISAEEVIVAEIEIPKKPANPNEIIEKFFNEKRQGEGLNAIELQNVSGILKNETLTQENILKAFIMMVAQFRLSMKPEQQKKVNEYLGKIADIYIEQGQFNEAARYFLKEVKGPYYKERIHGILFSIGLNMTDTKLFDEIYFYLLRVPKFKISESDIALLKKHGRVIDSENISYQEAQTHEKDSKETIHNESDDESPKQIMASLDRLPPPTLIQKTTQKSGNMAPGVAEVLVIQLQKRGFSIEKNDEKECVTITVTKEGSSLSILDDNGKSIKEIGFGENHIIRKPHGNNIFLENRVFGCLSIRIEGGNGKKSYIRINGKPA